MECKGEEPGGEIKASYEVLQGEACNGEDSLGKDSLGKDSLGKESRGPEGVGLEDCIIIVAGMPRSMSTWVYNIVRLALEISGFYLPARGYLNKAIIRILRREGRGLAKTHQFWPNLQSMELLTFVTERSLCEVWESYVRRRRALGQTPESMIPYLSTVAQNYEAWQNADESGLIGECVFLDHATICANELETAQHILNRVEDHIGCEVPFAVEAIKAVSALKPPKGGTELNYDPVTLLGPAHHSNGETVEGLEKDYELIKSEFGEEYA